MRLSIVNNSLVNFELVFVNKKLRNNRITYCLDTTFSIPEFLDLLNNHKIYEEGCCLSNKSKFVSVFNDDKNIYRLIIFPTDVTMPDDVFVVADTMDDAINIMNRKYYCRDIIACWKININDTFVMKGE